MPVVLCYGDSNTHGAGPVDGARFPRSVRWPGVLAAELGGTMEIIEEGLNGRTTIWDDPFVPGRNGRDYLLPCLRSHQPVNVVVLMLGTNDLKSIFARAAHEIASGVGALADVVLASGTGPGGGAPRVLVVGPPRLGPATDRSELWGYGGARATAEALPRLYRTMAEAKGLGFLDAAALAGGGSADGVHLDEAGHGILGRAVARVVREML